MYNVYLPVLLFEETRISPSLNHSAVERGVRAVRPHRAPGPVGARKSLRCKKQKPVLRFLLVLNGPPSKFIFYV